MAEVPDFGRHLGYDGEVIGRHSTGRAVRLPLATENCWILMPVLGGSLSWKRGYGRRSGMVLRRNLVVAVMAAALDYVRAGCPDIMRSPVREPDQRQPEVPTPTVWNRCRPRRRGRGVPGIPVIAAIRPQPPGPSKKRRSVNASIRMFLFFGNQVD